jgi:hypothetical protein
MQTPFPPSADRLQPVRVGIAVLLTGSALLLTGTIAIRLYSVIKATEQLRIDQLHQAILARGDYLKTAQHYEDCIIEAQKVPVESLFYSQAKTLQDQCQSLSTEAILNRAQAMADAGQLKAAIAAVKTVTDRAAIDRAQQMVWDWSNRILQIAEGYYLDPTNKYQDAIDIASAIGSDNPLYSEALSKIHRWQQDWLVNQNYWQTAQSALNAHQLELALLQVQQITHPYWKQQSTAIVNAIYAGQTTAPQSTPDSAPLQKASEPELPSLTPDQEDLNFSSIMLLLFLMPLSLGTLLAVNCRPAK